MNTDRSEPLLLREVSANLIIARRVYAATTFRDRALGLLARRRPKPDEALWINPCGGIHTWGLKYRIDVVFLSRDLGVLRVARRVKPWRLVFAPLGTRSVLEFTMGGADRVQVGDQLELTATAA